MAVPEAVNPQITDAVTQTNSRSGSPRESLYMATAHAMGIAAENAVNSQNQQNILAQAATTQGIMQIYALDTMSDAAAAGGDKLASTLQAQLASLPTNTATTSIDQAIEALAKVGPSGDNAWPAELREVMRAVAESLHDLQAVSSEYCMNMLKQAAMSAALARLIKAPEQLDQYEKILELIKSL